MNITSTLSQHTHPLTPEAAITVDSEVGVGAAGRLRERIGQAMGPRGTVVVVDASAITSLADADLRELLAVHTRLAASGRTLLVRSAPSPVATFLRHAGLMVVPEGVPAA